MSLINNGGDICLYYRHLKDKTKIRGRLGNSRGVGCDNAVFWRDVGLDTKKSSCFGLVADVATEAVERRKGLIGTNNECDAVSINTQ